MEKDAKDFAQKCNECQRHAPMIYQPGEMIHPVLLPWPFMKWGVYIVVPLPWAPGKAQYILLMIDYFSKWVKTQMFETIREKEVIDFIWDHIIGQLRIPGEIICDNGKQFIGNKRLIDSKGKLKEFLLEVLWAYRTTLKSSTGATPFSLVYGVFALIPVEVGELSIRLQYGTEMSNGKAMSASLDLLDERQEASLVWLCKDP
nr:uncharacterized protein LOC117276243 [Nicotiana tomentosiformis]